MPDHPVVNARRILWAGPLTVAAAVLGVLVVRIAAVATLDLPPPPDTFLPLGWFFPIFDTVVLVTAAVIVFAIVARVSTSPVRAYWWIAFVVLLLSMIPDLQIHRRRPDLFTWPRTSVLMGMHVVAWLITVTLLTKLTCSKRAD
jgi:hypothetical protein